jgi:hypothetical protein
VSKTFFVKVDAWKASPWTLREVYGIFKYLEASEALRLFKFLRETQQKLPVMALWAGMISASARRAN